MTDEEFDELWNTCDWRGLIDSLRSENERLRTQLSGQTCFVPPEFQQQLEEAMAHNAMLVDAANSVVQGTHGSWIWDERVLSNALNATSESIQQWIDKHDAEVRRNALLNAATWFDANEYCAREHGEITAFAEKQLRRMADEVKPGASTNG